MTGGAALTIPFDLPAGRDGFTPSISLDYSSSSGSGAYGLGWDLSLGSIRLRTEAGVPVYDGDDEVLLSGSRLVRSRTEQGAIIQISRMVHGVNFLVTAFRPQVEAAYARIERWASSADSADVRWRVITGVNVTTWYGNDAESRVFDPADPSRIAVWLPCLSHDDRGNAIRYRYRSEDSTGLDPHAVHEAARTALGRTANRYLRLVSYGNRTPFLPALTAAGDASPEPNDWLFHLVLDYGDHDDADPGLDPDADWLARPDPSSSRRAGFEVRTYRRCRRALVFHAFPELGPKPVLVRSTRLDYGGDEPAAVSLLTAVTRSGHGENGDTADFPTLKLSYLLPQGSGSVAPVDREQLLGAPIGIEGSDYEWVDLDGDGAPGILTRRQGVWYYKRNLGPLSVTQPGTSRARFAAAVPVADLPAGLPHLDSRPNGGLDASRPALVDVDGDGRVDLLLLDGFAPGSALRSGSTWQPFRPFPTAVRLAPAGDSRDRSSQNTSSTLVDLTGDGLLDLLIADGQAPRWHPGLGVDGFAAARPTQTDPPPGTRVDEPLLLHTDQYRAVLLADLDGDGLADLVEVSRTSISYRPNLGHGRFGRWVVMDDTPELDTVDFFDPSRVLLADVDGTGPVDLIYLASNQTRLYRNRSGNSWSPATVLRGVPAPDQLTKVAVIDLFGCGTGALVWSTAAPSPDGLAMHYLELASTGKPYLLSSYDNGFGLTVSLKYTPSTAYGLQDALDGSPWPSRLPFPVQCLSEVVTHDAIRETTVGLSRTYHLGRYDGVDRQFMGFGRIDERDTENFVEGPEDLPPVLVRRWFHTGAALAEGSALLHAARNQYAEVQAPVLSEPELPAGLDAAAVRSATRALAGLELRSETYSEDRSVLAKIPYAVTERTVALRMIQPGGPRPPVTWVRRTQEPPVFQMVPDGEVSYQTERDPADPRVSQSVVLNVDDHGVVTLAASINHPRRLEDPNLPAAVRAAQQVLTVTVNQQELTTDVTDADHHRLRVPWRARNYELTGVDVPVGTAAAATDLRAGFLSATELDPAADVPDGLFRRLLGESRTTFLADDLATALPAGQLAFHGLPRETHQLALTASMATARFGPDVDEAALLTAGYVHLDGDDNWWVPSGYMEFAADARDHFLQPVGVVDALGGKTRIERRHDLLLTAVTNARGHRSEADYDLRALQTNQVTDVNENRSASRFDPLGCVVASAIMGKVGAGEGDTLDDPTVKLDYDLHRWRDAGLPAVVRVKAREQYGAANPRWQESRTYFDGGGGVIATKGQAAPGPASHWDEATGTVSQINTEPSPRWVGTGRTVLNNKGQPIRQYEPYFSDTAEFDRAAVLVEAGVSNLVRYDPLGRPERVDHPDGTFSRIEITPWQIISHDAVDTVLDSLWYTERGSPDPSGPEPADIQTRAAWAAASNAATPSSGHLDTLGRVVLAQSDNGDGDLRSARVESDLTRLRSVVLDTRGRTVISTGSDLNGHPIVTDSAERGRTVTLIDVLGQQVLTVDRLGRRYMIDYDDLHRPVGMRAAPGAAGNATLTSWLRYGDDLPGATARNAVGRPVQTYDGAGRIDVDGYDFRGSPTNVDRRYATQRNGLPDWTAVADATDPDAFAETLLDADIWRGSSTQDALGRPKRVLLPDGTVLTPVYDIGNRLATLDVQPGGSGPVIRVVDGQDTDASGRTVMRRLGSGVVTTFDYDPLSRRLSHQVTAAAASDPLQDLRYGYDPVGNVTGVDDAAQQTRFFANAVVTPRRTFTYDAIYQLTRATGRELAALGMPDGGDAPVQSLPHANDLQAVRSYSQEFSYDDLGNITQIRHLAGGNGWRRRYRYAYELNAAELTNRLSATSAPGDADGSFSQTYGYDELGNLVTLPQVTSLGWDILGRLASADLGGGGSVAYGYGASDSRVRKVVDKNGLLIETLYLGTTQITREWSAGVLRRERRKVQLGVDGGTAAQLDRLTVDNAVPASTTVLRYVHNDHLGSATVVTNETGEVVHYEEYHPYGSTAYRSSKASEDVSLRSYRFLSRERDEETGFYHFGARAYAPWLGRWTSPDPAGYVDGLNLYRYARNNPITLSDPSGLQPDNGRVTVIREGKFTGKETFEELKKGVADIKGYHMRSDATPSNYQKFWIPDRRIWNLLDVDAAPETSPDGASTGQMQTSSSPPANTAGDPGVGSDAEPDGGRNVPAPGAATKDEDYPARSGGSGAVGWWDSVIRGDYVKSNRARSDQALNVIETAKAEGDAAKAMAAAKTASDERTAARIASQKELSPGGRAMSEAIDTGQDFADSTSKYKNRLPSVEGGTSQIAESEVELARRVAVGAGETRASMKALAKVGRVAGPVAVALGVGLAIWAIANAPEGQHERVAARELGAFVFGAIGASVGMSAGVAAAGFLSGLLIGLGVISGPIGWLAIGLGLIAGSAVAYWWSQRGGQIGEAAYDAL